LVDGEQLGVVGVDKYLAGEAEGDVVDVNDEE
jgi:hypothetical protein